MRIPLTLTALMLGAAAPVLAQSLQGVWKPAEVVITGGSDAGRHASDVQPGLIIFTARHYSILYVQGYVARPAFSATPTDEERTRIWTPFTANAGTYVVKDSILTYTPSVAKNPEVMAGTPISIRFRVLADSLWVTNSSSGGRETRAKWVRVERLQGR